MKSLRVLRYKHTSPFHASIPISPIALAIPIHHQRPMFSTKQTTPPSIPHEVRTATEPRQNRLYNVQLSHIEQINPSVKLLQLTIPPSESKKEEVEVEEDDTPADSENQQPFTFLPGQWLDVHVPSVSKAGGFSITSTPADARVLPAPEHSSEQLGIEEIESAGRPPYVELAVQDAPTNPAAAWLWKEPREILGRELSIRVGGSFVWPPSSLPSGMEVEGIRSVVLIAGGMGIK